jgi:hypothetical protein
MKLWRIWPVTHTRDDRTRLVRDENVVGNLPLH